MHNAYFSLYCKISPIAITLRFFIVIIGNFLKNWEYPLLMFSLLSLTIGSLSAIIQTNLKRLFAYSSISHMGFIFLGLTSGIIATRHDVSRNAYAASLFYLIIYCLSALLIFGVLLFLSKEDHEYKEIKDLKGLNQYDSSLAVLILISMFSFAGIPPFIGFYSKVSIFQLMIENGNIIPAIIAIFFTLISAFYCLRIVKNVYFDKPVLSNNTSLVFFSKTKYLLYANGIIIILFSLFPDALMNICIQIIENSFKDNYLSY
ncbi:MAG: hypothetical protein IR526_01155 [Bordetella sp.]|nr:MAG: hypothetical protein IR526_01155 [Bordetella sp.]